MVLGLIASDISDSFYFLSFRNVCLDFLFREHNGSAKFHNIVQVIIFSICPKVCVSQTGKASRAIM